MFCLNLDNSIVCMFLLLTLVVGIFAGRGTKMIEGYALANKMYGTVTLVMAYLATDIGAGSILSDAASVFNRGIIVNLSITSLAIAFVIRAIFIAPKMIYFKNCLTMGEVMGNLYGKGARVTTGLLGFFNATILASIQLMALGMIGASLLGIKPIWGTLIGGSIMIVYASIGGMKAVTVTDVIQFFMLIVAVPMIAYVAVYHIGGIKALFSKVPSEKFVVLGHQRFNRYLLYFVIWLLQMGMIDPAVVQRMLMAKDKFQLRNQYLIIAVFDPVFRFIVMLIGLAGVVLYPSIEGNNVVLHIIQELLPVGLKGLAIAGLLAVVMSSADAYLHVASLTLVHDVIAPYCKSNAFNELYWVRYTTVFVGLFTLMMGIKIVPISYLGFKALEVIAPIKVLNCLTEKVLDDKKAIQKAVEQLDAFTTYCKNSFYYSMDYLRLNVGPIEVNKLLSKVAQSLRHLGVADRVEVQLDTRQSLIYCDGEKIVQLLVNSIGQIQSASTCVLLILSVQDTALHYHFQAVTDENYKRELAALGFVLTTESKALTLQPSYQGSTKASQISVPENIADLVQRKNERILDAHYGYSEVAMTASGQQLLYIIPVDLRAIRSKVVDEVPLLGKGLLETEYSLAIERTFLTKLQEKATLDLDIAQEAIAQVKRMHQGQFRKSGELFYTHPLTVATILLDMTQDPDAIVAALLHDIVEDTPLSLDQVTYQYGKEVAYMVGKLTCLDFTIRKTKLTNREYQQQLTLYHDTRVVMVKLADRLHNVRTLAFHSQEKQKRIAQETLTFYVPLGRKLKLDAVDQVVNELEIRCKKIINSLNRKLKDG